MGRRLRYRFRIAFAVLALAGVTLAAEPVGALTVDGAAVVFNPKKTDALSVKGRFRPFDAGSVTDVTVAFGDVTRRSRSRASS